MGVQDGYVGWVCGNSGCGRQLADIDFPAEPRVPCPDCGETARIYEKEPQVATTHLTATGTLSVARGVNDLRIGAWFFILALACGLATAGHDVWGVLALFVAGFLGASVATAVVYRVPTVRHLVMEYMHLLTGE